MTEVEWLFGLLGTLLALLGIYLALKFRLRKLLCFDFRESDLFRFLEEKGDVRVFYKTSEVERVVNRKVIIWNPGSVEIRTSDVDKGSRIGFRLSHGTGYVVSKHEIVGAVSGFEIVPTLDGLFIDFEVFDKESAAVIEMQELFSRDAIERPTEITGRIFGSTSPMRRVNIFGLGLQRLDALNWLVLSLSTVTLAGSMFFENSLGISEQDIFFAFALPAIAVTIFSIFIFPRLLSIWRFRPPRGVYKWI